MSQLMIDEATAVGVAATERRHRRYGYLAGGLGVFVVWNLTTVLGFVVFSNAGDLITDLGLDVAGPAAFLALLWPRLADRRQLATAVTGAAIAVALVPVAPAGVPILVSMVGVARVPIRRPTATRPADRGGHVNDALLVLVVLATGTYVFKSAGPLVLGDRRLPVRVQALVDLLPAALLASLAIVSTVGDGASVVIDARLRRADRRGRGAVAPGTVRRRDRAGVGCDGHRSRSRLTD